MTGNEIAGAVLFGVAIAWLRAASTRWPVAGFFADWILFTLALLALMLLVKLAMKQ